MTREGIISTLAQLGNGLVLIDCIVRKLKNNIG